MISLGVFLQKIVIFAPWPRSSMDRIQDSGSYDEGSNPFGVTNGR